MLEDTAVGSGAGFGAGGPVAGLWVGGPLWRRGSWEVAELPRRRRRR
jgi:hypothetical protein